jgi:hypothetical protein
MNDDMRPTSEVCRYSPQHTMDEVPATTVIDCGAVGMVLACQACADFYARMASGTDRRSQE